MKKVYTMEDGIELSHKQLTEFFGGILMGQYDDVVEKQRAKLGGRKMERRIYVYARSSKKYVVR